MQLILSPDQFNPHVLYYQAPSDMPEAQGQACINFGMPMEGAAGTSPLIAHTQFYFKATEKLLDDLSSPASLSPDQITRTSKQFLNNITVAHEIQYALLRNLAGKIQKGYAQEEAFQQHPHYHPPLPRLEQAPPVQEVPMPLPPPSHSSSGITHVASTLFQYATRHLYPSSHLASTQAVQALAMTPNPSSAVTPASSGAAAPQPPIATPATQPPTPKPLSATCLYRQGVVERIESLDRALQTHTIALQNALTALQRAKEDQDHTALYTNLKETRNQYTSTLREMRKLSDTMNEMFAQLQQEQALQWQMVLHTLQGQNRDHIEGDEKGQRLPENQPSSATPPALLFNGNIKDPRREVLFLQRLKEHHFHVYNVPGDGHCALHALFKNPRVLSTLRAFFCSLPNQAPSNGMPEHPADTLKRELRLTRQLIAEKVKYMMSTEDEDTKLIKRLEISECPQAQRAYFVKYNQKYPQDASEQQYQQLEECYWSELIEGNVTLSEYHLSALSLLLGMPILVHSLDYLTPDAIKHHLLRPTQEGVTPLPHGVNPIQDYYQAIYVPAIHGKRMDPADAIHIYNSHGHYQAMTVSKY